MVFTVVPQSRILPQAARQLSSSLAISHKTFFNFMTYTTSILTLT